MKLLGTSILMLYAATALATHVSWLRAREVVENLDDNDDQMDPRSQPNYTAFLDEDEVDLEIQHHSLDKRGYYTCYNRQVTLRFM